MTDEEIFKEDRDLFAMAVQTAFARFANSATLENLPDIQKSVEVLVRKLDRLKAQEAVLVASAKPPKDEQAENVHRIA